MRNMQGQSTEAHEQGQMPEGLVDPLDLTEHDFAGAQLFRCKVDTDGLPAEQLDEDETIEHSWGVQEMTAGDWVVIKPTSDGGTKRSGVRREAFERTYVDLGDGTYRKESYILAERIDTDFTFIGVDSDEPEHAPAGAFLVLNLDKYGEPIFINGRRDIFYYKEKHLVAGYEPVPEDDIA